MQATEEKEKTTRLSSKHSYGNPLGTGSAALCVSSATKVMEPFDCGLHYIICFLLGDRSIFSAYSCYYLRTELIIVSDIQNHC